MVGVWLYFVQVSVSTDRWKWRGVFCTRRCRALPFVPRIGVEGHQAGEFRGFRSLGSAWDCEANKKGIFVF